MSETSTYLSRLVKQILLQNLEARDNMMLVARVVHDFELSMLNKKKEDYYDLLFSDKLSSIKTIDRVWRLLQLNYPELRGNEWELRQIQSGRLSIMEYLQENQLSFNFEKNTK